GPEFALRQHQQLRPQRLQVRADGERQIQRDIEDVVLAEALACQLLPRVGGGRDDDAPARQLRFQLLDNARDRQHFSDGDGVDPDGVYCSLVKKPVRDRAQTLAQPGAVLAVAQHLQQPPRRADDQRQQQENAVERIHAAIVIALRPCTKPQLSIAARKADNRAMLRRYRLLLLVAALVASSSAVLWASKEFVMPKAADANTYPSR